MRRTNYDKMSCETVVTSSSIANGCKRAKESNKNLAKNVQRLDASTTYQSLVTYEEVIDLVKTAVSEDAELLNYRIEAFSSEKIGFLAAHKRLAVTYKTPSADNREERAISFFVKTLPHDSPSQAAYIEDKGVFLKEVEFFATVAPKLLERYGGEDWAPRCYLARRNLLIFEDARLRGFANRPKLLDERSLRSAIACTARFHACSLLAEESLKGKLNELFPDVVKESEFRRTEGRSYEWFVTAIKLGVSLAEELGLDTGRMFEASERVFDVAVPSRTKLNVICHGDLWSSNVMFDARDSCRLVDFQLLRYAPPTHDLMQLIYLTTRREYRERNERGLLEWYHESLRRSLAESGFEGVAPSFEEILRGAEEQRFPALVNAVLNFPTMLMDGRIGAEIMSDLDAYEAYFFRDRRPFVDRLMAVDREYGDRIKEAVRELAEMSLRIDSLPALT